MAGDRRAQAVAERAVELAAAAGVTLPDDLALWRFAGGRPHLPAAPRPGAPDELGPLLEAASSPAVRRRTGLHYTPAVVADGLVARAIGDRRTPTVGDPACGGGALLLAAGRYLARRSGATPGEVVAQLFGADVDPVAVATTEVSLLLWAGVRPSQGHLVVADGLAEVPWPPVDVVVGNPPFLSPLGASTARSAVTSRRLRERFGDAVRAYTDTAGLFLLAGIDLAAPGGTVAMLQPPSVLGSRDAGAVRAALAGRAELRAVWLPDVSGFADATVDVCAVVLDLPVVVPAAAGPAAAAAGPNHATPRAGSEVSWSAHLARAVGVPQVALRAGPTIGDEATVLAAFRHEYYGLVPHVVEADDEPTGRPLVTTGLVDLGTSAWGCRAARIGRRSWRAPVVRDSALEGRAALWAQRTHHPKVLVASQTRVVEVAVDEAGAWVPGVPLVAVVAAPERLWRLAAALAAPPVAAWAATRTAGTARSMRALKLSAPLIRAVPLPFDDDAWAAGAQALRAGDLVAFGAAMTAAYDAGHEVLTWWCDRAKLGCPPEASVR